MVRLQINTLIPLLSRCSLLTHLSRPNSFIRNTPPSPRYNYHNLVTTRSEWVTLPDLFILPPTTATHLNVTDHPRSFLIYFALDALDIPVLHYCAVARDSHQSLTPFKERAKNPRHRKPTRDEKLVGFRKGFCAQTPGTRLLRSHPEQTLRSC